MSFILNKPLDLLESRNDQLKLAIYSFLVWCAIWITIDRKVHLKQVPKKTSNDIKNRIVSIIHGQVLFWASAYSLIHDFQVGNNQMNTNEHQFIMIISISYFVYDLLNCIYYDICDMALVMHHSFAVLGYCSGVWGKYGGGTIMMCILCAEVSNLPMHARMILKNVNLRYTKSYEACEIAYMTLYMSFRGLIVPYLVYTAWVETNCPLIVRLTSFGLTAQSFYYIREMKNILRRLRRQQKERRKLGVHYSWLSVPPAVASLPYARHHQQKDKVF